MSNSILVPVECKNKDVHSFKIENTEIGSSPVRRTSYGSSRAQSNVVQIVFENGKFVELCMPQGFEINRRTTKINTIKLYGEINATIDRLQSEYDNRETIKNVIEEHESGTIKHVAKAVAASRRRAKRTEDVQK